MAVVEAVVSVVKQKLSDMPIKEPVGFHKVISKLEKKPGFLVGGEEDEDQGRQQKVKKWVDEYLNIVYEVEDDIETFALALARQRWGKTHSRIGYFFYHCAGPFFFFNNRKSCRNLRRQMMRIGNKIDLLNLEVPDESQSHHPDRQNSVANSDNNIIDDNHHHHHQADEEEGELVDQAQEQEVEGIFAMSQTVCPVKNAGSGAVKTPSLRQKRRTLTFSYSYEEEEESGIVGFQDDVNALVKRLKTSDKEGCGNNILSIVGEVGSGKTTLAQAIYKSKGVKKYFQGGRAWVSVSTDYTETDVLLSLLKQLESSKVQDHGVLLNPGQVLVDLLASSSSEKKYLIVIDNVHSGEVWDKLHVFLETRNGCSSSSSKIILTTCDEQVANSSASVDPHRMKGLSDEESWKMFLKKSRLPEESWAENESEEGQNKQKILKICKGLPLRIVLLAGLLSSKKEVDGLSSPVLDHISRKSLDILPLCYNDLPAHRKLCLLYLALFPKEFDIPVRRLVRLWLAEGFVEERRHPTEPEDVAEEYFDDLVNRNLIQISKFRSDGSPRRCRLHGVLHDYLLLKTQDIRLFHVHRSNSDCAKKATGGRFGLRRIVEYLDIESCNPDFSQLQYLRSYISFNIQKKDIPAKEVAYFVRKITGTRGFGLLGVLDLEGVYKPSLPDKLGVLFHLRYLGLRWTFLDNLPPSVGDLPLLETLDLKHTYINSLPNSIWKLKRLRHLNLNEIRLDMPKQPSSPLCRLLTLWGLFVDDKSLIKDGLSKLRSLRELGITFNLNPSSSLDLADWISKLTSLQSLRLRSKDERGRPSRLDLKTLLDLGKLSHLNLKGFLQKLPDIDEFPPGLKVLTLSFSRLTEDPMPTLGQLQNLTVLRLLANSYLGKKIVCPARGFTKLRDLKLWMLNGLVEWDVEEEAMPNLKKLNIRGCDNLSALSPSLLQRTTLEELILTKMPESFVVEVQQQKSDHTYLTVNNNWEFTALPAEWDEEEEEEEENVSDRRG